MAERVLNWGLLSTARINRALIPVLKTSPRNRLRAVASRSQATAEAYAREWKIERALGSYDALLADPEIDVIYNPLPNNLHAEWSIKALLAGKHVLCEKPLALTLDEVDAMTAAAQESGGVLAEAFMYRHHPQTLRVKEILDGGEIGKLKTIKGAFTFVFDREANFRWSAEAGGGSIWDVGCYPISYARMAAGMEPEAFSAWQTLGASGVDLLFVGQMKFPNGIYAQFDSSFISQFRSFMEFVGTEGVLEVPNPFKPGLLEKLHLRRGDHSQAIEVHGSELYSGEVEDMADAVLLRRPPRISLADSRGTVAAILGLIAAARSNQ